MLRNFFTRRFDFERNGTTIKKEMLAGTVSFFTIVYIIAVNSLILSEAGIPVEAGIIATILASFFGCVLMGILGNAPILLVPGMGINALFVYTIVQSLGLSWQEALAVVFTSGILFSIIAFTRLSDLLSRAIPHALKEAITVGLGLFLTLIGLEKGGLVTRGENSMIALGNLGDPHVQATLLTLVITLFLFMRNVKANFLLSILFGTFIAYLFGLLDMHELKNTAFSFEPYKNVFGAMSFASMTSLAFWIAVFSLTMVLVFENIGLVHGHTAMLKQPEKYRRSLQANALSALSCAFFGTSPTVSTVESATGIAAGGRTGFTAVTAGVLFLASAFFIPVIKLIPSSAIAPILMIIGALMLQHIKNIELNDFSEWFPAFVIIVMIPFTYSIADGIAFGFILYPLLKIAVGKTKEVSVPLVTVSLLFLMNFVFHII
ncbi:AGZA family xanthine/uracil permease-like MFS transporter [Anoxybacillus calidus]|uniref:AGZA family xanthine/uracil permease-like MFS transporter n=1 Tax=[Anoxybacillus] calidus TaxID=575178 RepID=A0A7V9Z1W7_9BACL|nr:NCS2 family permease [Anoxybacillus calidus]MBA2872398.1 AGZA family xanthine/uracil permease-like MFS transporter [Anoxybacillus calidus]